MGGRSKGGGGHTPHEAPDSLRSAQKLRAIGLISLGPIKGPTNKWKDTYFDNTPIQNANGVDDNDAGSFNFKNTEIQYNLGYQDQKPLDGFEASEREVSVGAEVKQQHPITRSVIDPDVTRLRLTIGVNALISQNDQGDTNGTSVDFQILVNNTPRGTYQIVGKSSSRFYRSYIIDDLPPRPFTVTVKRFTADSKSQRLQNGTHWVSYTEIIDTKLSYPNMAIVGIKTDSRYNPNFPNINFLLYGRIIKIPTTYNPEARTYAPGIWKGDWKLGWTNNPAWIFYDLITNKLAGLGQRIGDYGIDKFQLYEIAKYCDELVDDGYGGKEPRMVSNLWLTEQREAYNVLSDMASVFRAIAVWDGTQFTAIQDRPADPVCLYSQSNVKDGKFTRQYAAGKAIFTAVEVEYADERNMYQKAIEYVADDGMIARYGYNVKKMTAYGCTSRGQAHRYGKWVLETSRLEQCTITFAVGRQGLMHLPGDIIEVADNSYAGKVLGGRVVAISGKKVTLDQPVEIKGESYLNYITADGLVKIKIKSVDKANPAIIDLDSVPQGLSVFDNWVLKSGVVSTQLYRALGITENDDGSYTITALQHEPQKEAIVDGSASFMPSATTAHGAGVNKPANADVSFGDGGVKLTWTTSTNHGAVKYDVKLYRNGNLYSTHLDLDSPEISFDNLPNGRYTVEIRSKNRAGQLSDPITRTFEINLNIPRFVTKSLLFAIELDWDLPKTATVGNYTEVWRSTTNDISKAVKVATLPYPQNNYVMSGVPLSAEYYFWLRCGDKNDNKGEFTAAVFGEADHNPDNLLNAIEGKITKSHLGQELINSLKNDVNSAVSAETQKRHAALIAEANSRVKAIQDESIKISKKIEAETLKAAQGLQAEINARGTAIQKLEQVDNQQAKAIEQVTAKANSALSGIEVEREARIAADNAESKAREILTAKIGQHESSINQINQTIVRDRETSAQQVATLESAVRNIRVGGRNYLLDSSFKNGKWYKSQGGGSKATIDVDNGVLTISSDNATWKQYQINGYAHKGGLNELVDGAKVTISFEVMTPDDNTNGVIKYWMNMRADRIDNTHGGSTNPIVINQTAAPSKWSRVSVTGIAIQPTNFRGWRFILGVSTPGTVKFRNPKLEVGNVATDWTPAPEDLDQSELINAKFVDIRQVITSETEARTVWQNNAISRISGVESNIANIQRSVTSATKSISEVSQNLNAKIDNIKIGGRNYLLDSSFKNGKWYKSQGRGSKATIDVDNGVLTISSDNATWKQYQIKGYEHKGGLNELVDGAKVTISFEVMTPDDNTDGVIKYWMNMRADRIDNTHGGSTNPIVINQTAAPSKWSRVSVTGIAIQPTNFRGWRFILGVSTPGTVKFRNPKLEVGNVATDWTPAPEDLDQSELINAKFVDIRQVITSETEARTVWQNNAISRISGVESNIANIQRSVTSATKSISEVSQNLNAKIDNIKIGGRNYLLDSSFKNGKWYKSQGRGSKATIDVDNGVLTISSDNATWKQYQIKGYEHKGGLNELVDGAKVTISFEVMTPDDNTDGVIKYWMNMRADRIDNTHGGSTNPIVINQTAAPSKWSRVSVTGIAIQPTNFRGWRFILGVSTPGTVKFRNPKLEVGNVATDWTPAPEDTDSTISAVSADLTSYKQAQATKEQATAQQISGLTTRMANAESGISKVDKAVSDAKSSTATQLNQLSAAFRKVKTDLDAKIEEEKTARANADRAEAEKTATMTSRVANAESKISQVSKTVADVSGKLSSTHTIKTQVVGGGRTAIAGIALGASSDGKTAESSVIVMADKFGIVANANDSNVKQVFSVANGQVGIRGDLVVAGSVTNDKLSSGSGANLLTNPIFANPTNGVPYGWNPEGNAPNANRECRQDPDWGLKANGYLPNENVLKYWTANDAGAATYFGVVQRVPVTANRWYMASAYMGNHRSSKVELIIQYVNSNNVANGVIHLTAGTGYLFGGINNAERAKIKFKAPVDCVAINFYLRKTATQQGQANSYMFVARPMLEECTEYTTEPSPWANAGVTAVHGGSIIANTIRGDHIQANQEIRTPRISGGEIDISGNDGILRVGRTGNFLVRASSQNRGLVMNNDQIIVYDERGNVRVKIGRL